MPNANVLEQKKQIVADLVETLKSAQAGVLVDYRGITVEQDTILRSKLREAGVEYKVVKNTLTRFAANEVGFQELDEQLNGPTALAISTTDAVAPAKVISDFAKEVEAIQIKAGFVDGKVISLDEVKTLAATPSRDVLIAKIMGSLNAPISKLVRTLQALVDNGVEPSEIKSDVKAEDAVEAAPVEEAPVETSVEAPVEEAVVETASEETTDAPSEE